MPDYWRREVRACAVDAAVQDGPTRAQNAGSSFPAIAVSWTVNTSMGDADLRRLRMARDITRAMGSGSSFGRSGDASVNTTSSTATLRYATRFTFTPSTSNDSGASRPQNQTL